LTARRSANTGQSDEFYGKIRKESKTGLPDESENPPKQEKSGYRMHKKKTGTKAGLWCGGVG